MADFDQAIDVVLRHEGGYVNNPNDPGGATSYGISLRFLSEYPHAGDFDQDGDVDIEDIKNMSLEQAKDIYKMFWWDKYGYCQIPDQTIATKIFDFSVNMGAKRAHVLVQQSLNAAFGLNLTCDGILGNASYHVLCAVADGDEEQMFITALCDAAWQFYQNIATTNPKLKVFLNGWRNRAYDISVSNMM